MKAITSEKLPSYAGIYNSTSKISKQHKKDVENEEIQVYLSKLRELVPIMPKNRRLSKLEVIQYVIDYICDLQYALDNHPNINSAAVHSAAVMLCSNANASKQSNSNTLVNLLQRQPLGVIPSNVNSPNSSCSSVESSPNGKVTSSTDKPVSC